MYGESTLLPEIPAFVKLPSGNILLTIWILLDTIFLIPTAGVDKKIVSVFGIKAPPEMLNTLSILPENEAVVSQEPVTFGWIERDPVYNSPPKAALKANLSGAVLNPPFLIESGFII